MTLFPLEAGLSASLWDLFSAGGPSAVAMEALGRQLPSDDPRVERLKSSIEAHGSRAWLPRRAPGADLALVTPDNSEGVADVLAVIEIKAAAQTHWPLKSSAASLPQLSGDVASAITAEYFGGSHDFRDKICQVDLYRSRRWWRESDGIALDSPEAALWLLFDTKGRTVDEAFELASRPSAWISVDLKLFAAHLRELRRNRPLTEQQQDMIAVVLWHIYQAPGINLPVADEIAPHAIPLASNDESADTSTQAEPASAQ